MTSENKRHSTKKRVLVIAYSFPPVGGAGVQRATKFVKWLRDFGWEPTVLTVANPSVPALDRTLELDVPATVTVVKARTLEPSYAVKIRVSSSEQPKRSKSRWLLRLGKRALWEVARRLLQPDPQILWYLNAVRRGRELLERVRHDAIFVTAPPFSSFLIGVRLARLFGLPVVLDYRDEWGISNRYWENRSSGLWARFVQSALQRRVLQAADALIATTELSRQTLAEQAAAAGSTARVVCIYNGFDPDDFRWPSGTPPVDRFRLAYVGTLWNLTSVEPLVRAVQTLSRQRPELAAKLELVFAGRRTAAQEALLEQFANTPCLLHRLPYLEHAEAVDLMMSADGLCLLLSDVPHADRVVPGKLFEYMATGKSILFVGPKGEAWRLLEPHGPAVCFRPVDTDAIAKALAGWVQKKFDRGGSDANQPADGTWHSSTGLRLTEYLRQFDRRTLTAQLARLLDDVVQQRGRPSSSEAAPERASERPTAFDERSACTRGIAKDEPDARQGLSTCLPDADWLPSELSREAFSETESPSGLGDSDTREGGADDELDL